MLLALSSALLASPRPARAANGLPTAAANFVSPVTPGAANAPVTVGTTMTVTQTQDKAILNWADFNIAAGHTVQFQQPSATAAALNRIGSNAPSQIDGALKANGQIYLINTNGIVFGTGATVDVNSLTASSLDIQDALFKAGILSKNASPLLTAAFAGTGKEGDVSVQSGAALTAASGGRIMLVAPNVHNQGLITAPNGQIILAAGAKVYLQKSDDPALRGLLVEVDSSCDVSADCSGSNRAENLGASTAGGTDLGQLLATHGNITLAGLVVNQSGRVTATSSVNANGTIDLLAEHAVFKSTQGVVSATRGGQLTLGVNSITEVTPDVEDATTIVDEQALLSSQVRVVGKTVEVQKNSRITAHSGKVTLVASADLSQVDPTTNALTINARATPDGSRIYIDQSARIDVSGTRNVVLPMSHNLVQVKRLGNELADSPLQRNGILFHKDITVDARVGTPLADVQGAVAGIGRTMAERTTTGGTINLWSTGDVVINKGATLDVSGGSKQLLGGNLNTTRLVSKGVTYDIGNASPDRVYDGIVGVFTKTYAQWNVTESWDVLGPGAGNTARYVPGYIEGADAGTVNVNTFNFQQGGTLLGNVTAGIYQRGVRPAKAADCDLGCQANTAPHGGQFILGGSASIDSQPFSRVGDIIFGTTFAPHTVGLNDPFPGATSEQPIQPVELSTALFDSGGFTRLQVYSHGRIDLPQGVTLTTAPGGDIQLHAQHIDIAGTIKSPGGSLDISTVFGYPGDPAANYDITLEKQARIDLSGLWANDLPTGPTPTTWTSTAINGGSATFSAVRNLNLAAGGLVDVSGGAWLKSNGKLQLGKGGEIALKTANALGRVTPDATLRGYAPGTGGSLSITTGAVCIGGSDCGAPTDALVLAPRFFEQGGFGSYAVTANAAGLTVARDTHIDLMAQNLLLGSNANLMASGTDINSFSALGTLPDDQRAPVNLTLSSTSKGAAGFSSATGVLKFDAQARVNADTGAALTLVADRRIDLEGALSAPAGNISLSLTKPSGADQGYDASQSIWLGADSVLSVRGTTQLVPNDLNLRQGQVLAGGTVTLDAQRGYVVAEKGAVVDVSGARDTLDIQQRDGSYQPTDLASAAGTINISTTEGMLWYGTLRAQSRAPSMRGGTLKVTLTRSKAGCDSSTGNCGVIGGNPFPNNDRRIVLQNGTGNALPAGLHSGDSIDAALPNANGIAQINSAWLNSSGASGFDNGFDNVALTSDKTIQFNDNMNLALRGTLRLDAPQLTVANNSTVNLRADYLGLGASETRYQEISGAPTAGAGNGIAGKGLLNAYATSLLELIGNVALSGVKNTELHSGGDLRLHSVWTNAHPLTLNGALYTVGGLMLQADQIYPTTLSDYSIQVGDPLNPNPDLTLAIHGGNAATPVLSAGAALSLSAPNIVSDGVIKVPLGTLKFYAANSLNLEASSITSTSAEGQTIPFGTVQSGTGWTYDLAGNLVPFTVPPAKSITLSSGTDGKITISPRATLDISGGGDLLGYEWVPGPGGSKDVLSWDTSPNSYAVLPTLSAGAYAPFDQQYYAGTAVQPGDSVYLSGGGGLAAGTYALLPARYALLPGAFLLTPVSGYQDLAPGGTPTTLLNGATVVPGYRTLANTGLRSDPRWSGFAVRPGAGTAPATYASEYDISTANAFFAAAAAKAGTAVPRLPMDAGQLAINAGSALTLEGHLLVTPGGSGAQAGRGAQVDIAAQDLAVVNALDPHASGVQLLGTTLNDLGAESLFLGGTRSLASDSTLLNVTANDVTIAADVQLSGTEFLLAAKHKVSVQSGAQLTATGKINTTTADTLIIGRDGNGDGALLRLSMGPQAAIVRENRQNADGILEVQTNSLLQTTGSLALDATQTTGAAGRLAVGGPNSSLSLGAAHINLGAVDPNAAGLNLDNTQLANFQQLSQLVLRSYDSVDLYGAAVLGGVDANNKPLLQNLAIEAAALRGFNNANGKAVLTAGTIRFSNPSNAGLPTDTANGTGQLQVQALSTANTNGEIDLGAGNFAIAGFNGTTLSADSQIVTGAKAVALNANSQAVTSAKGSLTVGGDLNLVARRVIADSGSDYTINAATHVLNVATPTTANNQTALVTAASAGKLSLTAESVNLAGRIDMPAGVLAVTANHDIHLDGSIDANGVAQTFATETRYMPGGVVSLNSSGGNIIIGNSAAINVAGAAQGGDAGQLSLSAAQGTVQIDPQAKLSGGATAGYKAGSFLLNTDALAEVGGVNRFSTLNNQLSRNGFTQQQVLNVRTGDVHIAAKDTVHAHNFALTVANGALTVDGRIDASATTDASGAVDGGQIHLAAADTISLNADAKLDAHGTVAKASDGTPTLGAGGSVALSTGTSGRLALNGGSIDVSPGFIANKDGKITAAGTPGHIYLRAPRTGVNSINTGGRDVAIDGSIDDPTHKQITNLEKTYDAYPGLAQAVGLVDLTVEAYQYQSYQHKTTIDGALIGQIATDVAAFTKDQTATARLTALMDDASKKQFHLTPGVEVQSDGDLTLANAWNLYQDGRVYNGGVAGVLTLRAKGNLNINKSLSDGFSDTTAGAAFNGGTRQVAATDPNGNTIYQVYTDENDRNKVKYVLVNGQKVPVMVTVPNAPSATWSYRLVAGADLNSPDPLALQSAATFAPGTGDIHIANDTLVRTGNGRIDVAAGHNFILGNKGSVLYTAGTAAAPLFQQEQTAASGEPQPQPFPIFSPVSTANYATAGGDVSLTAQNDVVGAVTDQLVNSWLYRQGQTNPDGSLSTNTSWWLSFATFKQNIGALGGGNVDVKAGRDITDLSAVIPTTGRLATTSGVAPHASDLTTLGGGNLKISAAGDVASGIFYVGKGTGQITAGGGLTNDNDPNSGATRPYTILALGDARFNVQARNDVTLETVLNPTALPQAKTQIKKFGSVYFTYSPESAVAVQALSGKVTFNNTYDIGSPKFDLPFGGSLSKELTWVYPGTLTATAYQNDIVMRGNLHLFPAASGSLQLLAGRDIVAAAQLTQSDADPMALPQPLAPATSLRPGDFPPQFDNAHAPTPVHNQPGNPDLKPALVIAGRDITGSFQLAKSVRVYAGRDLKDLKLAVQNLRNADITSLIAGRDIFYKSTNTDGTVFNNTNNITVAGPGAVWVQAGRNVDLGSSGGIVTTGNIRNPALPAQGADVTVAAGITTTPDYNAFMTRVLDPAHLPPASAASYPAAHKYVAELTAYMTALENLPEGALTDAQAYADFRALSAATQLQFLQPLTTAVFIDRYLDPAGPTTTYTNVARTKTQSAGKYYGKDPSGAGKYLTDYMMRYNNATPASLSDAQALADFRALPIETQQAFMLQVFYNELRTTGRAHTASGFGYQQGYDAISALFPASNYQGDLNLYFSQIRTLAGGNINLLVPGGLVNAGLANPPPTLTKEANELGIVAQGAGDVRAFVKGDFLVNQSRVFTLLGGDILIWTSQGNIDAGRGAKSAITVPPPTVTTNADGNTVFNFSGAATGSGIREILTSPDVKPGSVDLIAPNGEVNAGEAGIGAAGNLNIAAQTVVGADNIQVGGVSTGVPASGNAALSAGLTGTSNLAGDANSVAANVAKSVGAGDATGNLAYLSVDVLGFGDCTGADCQQ